MKDGKLNARELKKLQDAADVLCAWCDWECDAERQEADLDPTLADVECSASGAAGLIRDFLYEYGLRFG